MLSFWSPTAVVLIALTVDIYSYDKWNKTKVINGTLLEKLDDEIIRMLSNPRKQEFKLLHSFLYLYSFAMVNMKRVVYMKQNEGIERGCYNVFSRRKPWLVTINVSDENLLNAGWSIYDLSNFYQYCIQLKKTWEGLKKLLMLDHEN